MCIVVGPLDCILFALDDIAIVEPDRGLEEVIERRGLHPPDRRVREVPDDDGFVNATAVDTVWRVKNCTQTRDH